MARNPSEDLYQLIQALTTSQQRYYSLKLSLGKSPQLKTLFKVMQEHKGGFNEEFFFVKVNTEAPSITRSRYNILKVQLYGDILKVLRHYHASDTDIDSDIRNSLHDIHTLRKLKLYPQARKILEIAKAKAYKFQHYIMLPELLACEREIGYVQITSGESTKALETETSQAFTYAKWTAEVDIALALLEGRSKFNTFNYKGVPNDMTKLMKEQLKQGVFRKDVTSKYVKAEAVRLLLLSQIEMRENLYTGESGKQKDGAFDQMIKFLQRLWAEGFMGVLEADSNFFYLFIYNLFATASRSFKNSSAHLAKMSEVLNAIKFGGDSFLPARSNISYILSLRLSYYKGSHDEFNAAQKNYHDAFEDSQTQLPGEFVCEVYYWLGLNFFALRQYAKSVTWFEKVLELYNLKSYEYNTMHDDAVLLLVIIMAIEAEEVKGASYFHMAYSKLRKPHARYERISKAVLNFYDIYSSAKGDKMALYHFVFEKLAEPYPGGPDIKATLRWRFDFYQWFESIVYDKPFHKLILPPYRSFLAQSS